MDIKLKNTENEAQIIRKEDLDNVVPQLKEVREWCQE